MVKVLKKVLKNADKNLAFLLRIQAISEY